MSNPGHLNQWTARSVTSNQACLHSQKTAHSVTSSLISPHSQRAVVTFCDQQPQIDSPFGDFGGGIGGDFDNISQGPGDDMMPGGFGDDMNIFVSGSSAQ